MTTEIYVCMDGQELRDGRLELSESIGDKAAAEADARARCARDPAIARVAYYAVADSGAFRLILAYTNPAPRRAAPPRRASGPAPRRRPAARPAAPPPGLWRRLLRALGIGPG